LVVRIKVERQKKDDELGEIGLTAPPNNRIFEMTSEPIRSIKRPREMMRKMDAFA
jgi:hypothetical protein